MDYLPKQLQAMTEEAREREAKAKRSKSGEPDELQGVMSQYKYMMIKAAEGGAYDVILPSRFSLQFPRPDPLCKYDLTAQQFGCVIEKLRAVGLNASDADGAKGGVLLCRVHWADDSKK